MAFQHERLAGGGWASLSFAEQMGNIGSEVSRAARWRGRDEARFEGAVSRALELFDLTVGDPRWRAGRRLREILRAREAVCDAARGGSEYGGTLESLQKYFDAFAVAARR